MSVFTAAFEEDSKSKEEIKENLDQLEIQLFRMQQSMQEISKKWDVLGIDQTKDENWVVVYAQNDGKQCKVMVNDCDSSFKGVWDFSIHATYTDDETIHIGDIKGPANKGYGSICMKHLKDIAREQNIPYITGDIANRDWDHVDRLIHFYEKHNFNIEINNKTKSGEIVWNQQ